VTSLRWKYNRLKTMGLPEVTYRIGQAARTLAESLGLGLAGSPPTPRGQQGRPWVHPLPIEFDGSRPDYIERADKILGGFFNVFALKETHLGFPPDWNRDPKSGKQAPLKFGKAIDYRNNDLVGDIKYLWEPNRHLELVSLAQAWHLSQEERYLAGARLMLTSWFDQNPYPMGVNWTSSLELGIRLVNWSFAWHLFGGSQSRLFQGAEGARLKNVWLDCIYQHCFFISRHFSRHSSANNHIIGEYAGLFIGAVTWPFWKESRRWIDIARRGLEREMLVQNAPDGGNREQAFWYQHEVADMFILCSLVGRANGVDFSDRYESRLEAILAFITAMMDCAGRVPMIGDSDDAVIVDLSINRDVYRSLLATGSVLFSRADFRARSTAFDDKSRWLLGDDGRRRYEMLSSNGSCFPTGVSFPDSGYYVLGTAFGSPEEIRLIADAGPLGYLSIAAHGHADALSLVLSVGGHEVLVDPGTYSYHTQQKWRDYFKGTSAHNTVRIDRLDQSVSSGNFMWAIHANAVCDQFNAENQFDSWDAQHDGYRRLGDPVVHRRTIRFDKEALVFSITDFLDCKAKHDVEIHWHCSEHCTVTCEDQGIRIIVEDVEVVMSMPESSWRPEVIKGRETPPLGWISREFDVKVSSPTVRWSGSIDGNTQLTTLICIRRGA
jgi:hypothetical protein